MNLILSKPLTSLRARFQCLLVEDMQKKKYSIKKVFTWYWRTLPRYRWFYVGIFFSYGIGTVSANIVMPVFFKNIIDLLTSVEPDLHLLWKLVAGMGGLYAFFYLMYRVGDFLFAHVEINATKDLAIFNFQKLQEQSYEFFTQESSGSLIAKATRFIGAFEEILSDITFSFWANGLKFTGMMLVLLYVSPPLAGLLFLWAIVIFVCSYPFLKQSWKYDNDHAEATSRVTERLADVITNALTVKIFSAFQKEKTSFQAVTQDEASARRLAWDAFMKLVSVQAGLILLLEFCGIALAIWFWQSGSISVGTVVLIITYMFSLFDIIWNMSRNIARFLRHLSRASEMIEIFERIPSVQDAEHPVKFTVGEGGIVFEHITFGYKNDRMIFKDFSLTVQPGEKVGLVGPSGAGKSTLTKLLLRFFDPQSGQVLIDGQDIKGAAQNVLRQSIGYVPQEALLFHRSIGENIAYGKDGATMEEVRQAASKAEAHEFIEHLMNQYDTMVGDRGVKLSGGERQRVAIARAILKNAPILVLDEATSSLDSTSEAAIKKALNELMKGKTALVIAHRLSTIQKMDRIVVLNKQGNIEEMGTHKELLAHDGLYASLWNHQVGGFIDEDTIV